MKWPAGLPWMLGLAAGFYLWVGSLALLTGWAGVELARRSGRKPGPAGEADVDLPVLSPGRPSG